MLNLEKGPRFANECAMQTNVLVFMLFRLLDEAVHKSLSAFLANQGLQYSCFLFYFLLLFIAKSNYTLFFNSFLPSFLTQSVWFIWNLDETRSCSFINQYTNWFYLFILKEPSKRSWKKQSLLNHTIEPTSQKWEREK